MRILEAWDTLVMQCFLVAYCEISQSWLDFSLYTHSPKLRLMCILKNQVTHGNFDWLTRYGVWAHIPLITHMLRARVFFRNNCSRFWGISLGVFNKTIIPLALVGYEIVIANSYPTRARGIIVKYATRNHCITSTYLVMPLCTTCDVTN